MKLIYQVPVWVDVEAESADEAWAVVTNLLVEKNLHTEFDILNYTVEEPQLYPDEDRA